MSKQLAELIKANRVEIGGHTVNRAKMPQFVSCRGCEISFYLPEEVQHFTPEKQVCFELYLYGVFKHTECNSSDESDVVDDPITEMYKSSTERSVDIAQLLDAETETLKYSKSL